jgi:hypothetical protein
VESLSGFSCSSAETPNNICFLLDFDTFVLEGRHADAPPGSPAQKNLRSVILPPVILSFDPFSVFVTEARPRGLGSVLRHA